MQSRLPTIIAALACAALACDRGAAPVDTDADATDDATATTAPVVVHEWATVSSFQDEAGDYVAGLHRAEEALPGFVLAAARDVGPAGSGAAVTLPGGVTQRIATAALFFHPTAASEQALSVSITLPDAVPDVAWPGGVMSPAGGGDGRVDWMAALSADGSALGTASGVWSSLREADGATLEVEAAGASAGRERFLFYRALGTFAPPVRALPDEQGLLRIENLGGETIRAAFLIKVHEAGGGLIELGEITVGGSVVAEPTPKEHPDVFAESAQLRLRAALVAEGLTEAEAAAAIGTWPESLFTTPGMRVVYTMPRAWIDEIAPLTVSPAPEAVTRVWIGRIEVMLDVERELLRVRLADAAEQDDYGVVDELGVFAEPKLRSVRDQLVDPDVRAFCDALIAEATALD